MDPLLEQFNLSLYRSNVAIYNGEGQDITQYLSGYYTTTPRGVVTGLADLGSGDYPGTMAISSGAMRSANFKSGTLGWQLSHDGIIRAVGAILSGTITATAGTIGGFTIGATTITGSTLVLDSTGSIKTASSGQRVVIDSSDNVIHIYDSVAEVIKLGTASATAITITTNSNNTDGIKITSATTATLGMRMDSSSNVVFNGLRIALTNTGASNSGYCAYLEQDGAGYGLNVVKAGTNDAIYVTNSGTGTALNILSTNNAAVAINIQANVTSAVLGAVKLDNTGTGSTLYILGGSPTGNTGVINISAANEGDVINLTQTINSSNAIIGLHMTLTNSGAGLEYAFRFDGSEAVSAAVGGTQDRKIRVLVGSTVYFIPCYTA